MATVVAPAPAHAAHSSAVNIEALGKALEKKATFESAAKGLRNALLQGQVQAPAVFPLVQRTFTLLRARYSNVAFWVVGHALFNAYLQSSDLKPEQRDKVQQFLTAAEEFVQTDTDAPPSPAPAHFPVDALRMLAESQQQAAAASAAAAMETEGLGGAAGAAPTADDRAQQAAIMEQARLLELYGQLAGANQRGTHFDDAGFIVDDGTRWQRAQVSGRQEPVAQTARSNETGSGAAAGGVATAGQRASGQEGGGDGEEAGQQETPPQAQERQELQQQILEQMQAVFSGVEAMSRNSEAMEQEMERIISILAAQQGVPVNRKAPPASKRLLANLPREEISAARLEDLGKGHSCAVCTCELEVGDTVQILPCKHIFHPDCVAPWFAKHNSCPTCRFELPTDDAKYEAAKEKKKEEEEERRGAANANRGGEFMYC